MKKSYSIALAGVLGALALVFLTIAVHTPVQLAFYALSGCMLLPLLYKKMWSAAALQLCAVSVLGLLISGGNPIAVAPYMLFFGPHPFVSMLLERTKLHPAAKWAVKLVFFNAVFFAAYKLAALFFIDFGDLMYPYAAALSTAAFVLYDVLLFRLVKRGAPYLDKFMGGDR